ncbi:MAG TPA: hypothetical protein VEV17_07650 [Bryobacteraceae bacterium]|nr:hypothetical protein [Bryobacteraceae bacterium]
MHELGHVLIDLPRNEDGGDEHHDITDPKRVMYPGAGDDRGKFTKEECSHIFDNIDKYGGDCS